EVQEDVAKATTFTLVTCQTCGIATHIKLEYALSKAAAGEPPCRACYWSEWAAVVRREQGTPFERANPEEVRALAESRRYEYLRPLTNPSLREDPHHVRCIDCGRLSAQRRGDIGWGCQCQRASKTQARPRNAKPKLFKDSGLAALEMWDHEQNSEVDWATASVGARRSVHWRCPRCGHQFIESIQQRASF